jgi:hypothetical protein
VSSYLDFLGGEGEGRGLELHDIDGFIKTSKNSKKFCSLWHNIRPIYIVLITTRYLILSTYLNSFCLIYRCCWHVDCKFFLTDKWP